MCGISAIFGRDWSIDQLDAMLQIQSHRGPDAMMRYCDPDGLSALGHNRLSIIDLSEAGNQPMVDSSGKNWVILNGEIYNYLELRRELESDYSFVSQSDTEVLLAAYSKWGESCLDRLIGMFAFVIWDEKSKTAFGARDRFGVKPMYYHQKSDGTLIVASEIKAIHAAGIPRAANANVWSTYLTYGLYDHTHDTFWKDVQSIRAGHKFRFQNGRMTNSCWYDLSERLDDIDDERSTNDVEEEYLELLKDSVRLRFRSDVPVGINLSGGLDSSVLLGIVDSVQGEGSDVKAFTFATGDANYDELPWVESMVETTNHPLVECMLTAEQVPDLASEVQRFQDEPFGGLPTIAYARVFEEARKRGVIVLLDGNGMDEQWAGYDYYQAANRGETAGTIQGTKESPVRPECLNPEFRALARKWSPPNHFSDKVRGLQYRDTKYTKIPRALRFTDRVSMKSSTELREPFLDHRLFELAFRQPIERKISGTVGKKMLRDAVKDILPRNVSEAPKRALQTPQREWLRRELRDWANALINGVIDGDSGNWLDKDKTLASWRKFCEGGSDNSFYVWQWISLGLMEMKPEDTKSRNSGRDSSIAPNNIRKVKS